MQVKQRSGRYKLRNGKVLTPLDPDCHESFKVRCGRIGGNGEELSPEDGAWCDGVVAAFAARGAGGCDGR